MDLLTLLGILCLAKVTMTNHCSITYTKQNMMVDVDQTGNDITVDLVGAQKAVTSEECVNVCCHTGRCTSPGP